MVKSFASALAIACVFALPAKAHASCEDIVPREGAPSASRSMSTMDLARIRDVGDPDVVTNASSPYALSPDRRSVAFMISRGDPRTNAICSALIVMPIKGKGPLRIIDRGGALPRLAGVFRDLYITTGFPELIVPAWSPDGTSIAYRKLIDGVTQLVRVGADGGGAQTVTQEQDNVEDFAWSADGKRLIYFTRPGRQAARERIARDAGAGWRYDSSVLPMQSWEPQPWATDLVRKSFVVDLSDAHVRPATADEEAVINPPPRPGVPYELSVQSRDGSRAWTAPVSDHPNAKRQVWVQRADGLKTACADVRCTGRIGRLFWDRDGKSVIFLGREGWNNEDFVVHRWFPASNRLSTILRTTDALTGCISTDEDLICGRENATTPRRIVRIDLASGRDHLIFNPNPEFASLRLGTVARLKFSNDRGLPAWGDLVLPADYDGKSKLPLVIVQYHSNGFLRGGIGDDYPIFPMAAKGLAVLSFERPTSVANADETVKTWEQFRAAESRDWAERKSLLSAIDKGIDAAIATGTIDPKRIGITGLSDGASTIEFALVNSRRFAAAAMSTCCDDLLTSTVLGGFAWGEANRRAGMPPSVDNDRQFWKPISLSVNARKIDTPILMQLADREALLGLPAIGALTEAGKPLDVFVFPDEYHNKWQPAHRLAIYERDIEWFNFWLRGYEDPSPAKHEQYARWQGLRRKAVAPTGP
ncbi:acylaminoacyl-peptidase [Novosphingobium sp. Rr 2-17]|uniref:Atxe2 family lasso peptide isopeptidase n=1 Tax=Novosphingobium sp. Rr 2-17 TaxID=555793 RepID=UPI0002698BF5|nr:Atxe2 family lasso peptide isopeptidase [Novosphingobium sp. Rr 2-17]EIZ78131.1 acylaminoacyl-peptidase [Novosphingobium sp. Rr 2-17]